MVLTSALRIKVGSRVEGSHGPLISNPNVSKKRRVRKIVVGTVVRASGTAKWDVVFDFDGLAKVNISSRALKLVPDDSGIPLNESSSTCLSNKSTVTEPTVAMTVSDFVCNFV